jgi:hypothetical protein
MRYCGGEVMQSLEELCKVSVVGGEVVRPKVSYLPSEHQTYKVGGKKVCGASTIAGRDPDGKQMLIGWANKMGLKGICTSAFLKHSANIGTFAHKMVELCLEGNDDVESLDLLENSYLDSDFFNLYHYYATACYRKFSVWQTVYNSFEVIATELPLTSNIFGYGGTIDIYGQLGDKKVLIDIKTSSNVYMSHKLQVAGYAHLLEENGYEVDDVYILQISRDADKPYHFERIGGTEHLMSIFQDLLNGYNSHKELKTHMKTKEYKEAQALNESWLENLRRV